MFGATSVSICVTVKLQRTGELGKVTAVIVTLGLFPVISTLAVKSATLETAPPPFVDPFKIVAVQSVPEIAGGVDRVTCPPAQYQSIRYQWPWRDTCTGLLVNPGKNSVLLTTLVPTLLPAIGTASDPHRS